MLGVLEVQREQEDEERKVTFRFRLRFPQVLPASTRDHLRAARKESLLAFRDLATETIDRRIEFLERESKKKKKAQKIEVEEAKEGK